MDIKQFLFRSNIKGVLHEVMAVSDTTNVRVYKTDGSYTMLSDELTKLANSITTANDELYNKIMGFTDSDKTIDEAYDTLKEVAAYLEEHGDVVTGFTNAIADLQNKVGEYTIHYPLTSDYNYALGTTYYISDSGEVAHYYSFESPVDVNSATDTCEFVEEDGAIKFVVTRTTEVDGVTTTETYTADVTVTTDEPTEATNKTAELGEFSSLTSEIESSGLVGDMVQVKKDIQTLNTKTTTTDSKLTSLEEVVGKAAVEADEENGIEGSEATGLFKEIEDVKDSMTKVTASETNGNVNVDGEEVTVYTHPEAGHVHVVESEPVLSEMVEGDIYLQLSTTTV